MHPSSMENMYKCFTRYVAPTFQDRNLIKVLDIGGVDINGSYREIFSSDQFAYSSADTDPNQDADIHLPDNYQLPLPSESFDIVLCGQTLEHCEFFWLLFDEMIRVLRPDGLLLVIVPSSGPIHRFPVDCYRFYPDSLGALAKYSQCNLVDHWRDERGPWQDLVGVFSKTALEPYNASNPPPVRHTQSLYERNAGIAQNWVKPQMESNDTSAGSEHYVITLSRIHAELKPKVYLEIGVNTGVSLRLANCTSIAIDPNPCLSEPVSEECTLFTTSSDEFFEYYAQSTFGERKLDLAFIDGLHIFEFVLRDFINSEKYASDNAVIVIDDVFPNSYEQASRNRQSKVWTGDVWKIIPILRKFRPDLTLSVLDTHPSGLLIVSGLNARETRLTEYYNQIVRYSASLKLAEYEQEIIQRQHALNPSSFNIPH